MRQDESGHVFWGVEEGGSAMSCHSAQRFRGGRWIKEADQWMRVLGVGEVRAISVRAVDVSSHGTVYPPLHLGAVTEASHPPCRA